MSPQHAIAQYHIAAKLGLGGMGEVWRATDTKVNRESMIEVLPETLARELESSGPLYPRGARAGLAERGS